MRSRRTFYGWVIALAALVVLCVTNGITVSGINVFDEALLQTFGWSRGTLKFRDLLTFGLAGLAGPLAGALVDRFGPRRLMLFGATLLAVCLFLYGRIGSAAEMYGVHVLFAVVLATCGLVVSVILVSRWFVARRGTAIGIALVGSSVGGILFPQLGTWLIQELGWRRAIAAEAVAPLALLLVIAFVIRDSPRDVGQRPLGEGAKGAPAPSGGEAVERAGLTLREALRTGTFWALAFAAMMTFYAILAAQAHLFLHFRDLGFSPRTASTAISVLFGLALVGKFAFGMLADRLHQKRVFMTNLAVMLVGAVLLASLRVEVVWTAVVLFGLGWGGLYTLLQLLTVDSFGLKAAGKILGTVTVLDALGGGLGIWLTGLLYDRTGSYGVPFTVLAVLVFLALLAATRVRRHATGGRRRAVTEPAEVQGT